MQNLRKLNSWKESSIEVTRSCGKSGKKQKEGIDLDQCGQSFSQKD